MTKKIYTDRFENLSVDQINAAVITMSDSLNLSGGSVPGYDFYQLIQTYLLDSDKRRSINQLLNI